MRRRKPRSFQRVYQHHLETAPRTAEIPAVDGLPINESHPVGFEGLYATPEATGYGKATCAKCGETHNGWTPIRAGQWKCRCGETTNDDQMQIVGKAEYDLEQRLKRNGKSNGHKPTPTTDPPADEDWTNDEWYTPADIIQRVRAFMGEIDVDPASCDYAQRTVQAKTYYTRQTDGLIREWHGRVWLNPPYSYPLVERFTVELLRQYRQGIVKEAIVLVNNRTDAAWFQSLLVTAEATQFVSGRINFERKGLQTSANRQGQVFFYVGSRAVEYSMAFGDMGAVMRCMWGQKKA
ncbi:MAG: hypothetical protein IPK17_38680 [Chloroflexi bacterium]|uniref:DNA N-6-adenine-methyltransferase n=1 Tax=Candidatus Flexifilum breve TaxID=3140694 RepID=UPI0031362198|nr:hypothetical protein [Chloroflexota bacterium]